MYLKQEEQQTSEREKKLAFNKIKKHLEKYETLTMAEVISSEGFYRLKCKVPYAKRKPHFEEFNYATVQIKDDCVHFEFLPATMTFRHLDQAPALNHFFSHSKVFKFYQTMQIDEDQLKYVLKKGYEVFKKNGFIQ